MKATMLLEKQHRKVEELFKALETKRSRAPEIVEEIATDLSAHSTIEEEMFYPACKKFMKEMVLESYEEHQLMAFALKRLVAADVEDDSFMARVTALKEVVSHHVAEEEKELLPAAAEALGEDQDEALGKQMEARFKELERMGYEGAQAARRSRRSHEGEPHAGAKKKTSHKASHGAHRAA
jgi:hemerythrin superfamily protein